MTDPRQAAADRAEAFNMVMFSFQRLGRRFEALAVAAADATEALAREVAEAREGEEWKGDPDDDELPYTFDPDDVDDSPERP